jgi:hypothetical protein
MSGRALLGILIAWIGWAGGFLFLYALQATGCRAGWDEQMLGPISALRLLLIIATAAIVLLLFWLTAKANRDGSTSSLARIGVLANGAAILATMCFAGVVWLRLCA